MDLQVFHKNLYLDIDDGQRSYWILTKVQPSLTMNDNTYTLKRGSWKVVFKTQSNYNKAKKILSEYYPKLKSKTKSVRKSKRMSRKTRSKRTSRKTSRKSKRKSKRASKRRSKRKSSKQAKRKSK